MREKDFALIADYCLNRQIETKKDTINQLQKDDDKIFVKEIYVSKWSEESADRNSQHSKNFVEPLFNNIIQKNLIIMFIIS